MSGVNSQYDPIPAPQDIGIALSVEEVDTSFENDSGGAQNTQKIDQTDVTTALEAKPQSDETQQEDEWSRSQSVSIDFDLYHNREDLEEDDIKTPKTNELQDEEKPLSPQPQTTIEMGIKQGETNKNIDTETKHEEEKHETKKEEAISIFENTLEDTDIDIDSITKNVSICLGFLLHKDSPLWDQKGKHHSTKEILDQLSEQNKKGKATYPYSFADRCSIFQSDYVLGTDKEQPDNTSSFIENRSISEGLRKDIQHTSLGDGLKNLLNNIVGGLDESDKKKWDELAGYWDSWKENRHKNMEEFMDLQRFNWDDAYGESIDTVTNDIETLINGLQSLTNTNIERKERDDERMEQLRKVDSRHAMREWLQQFKRITADIEDESEVSYLQEALDEPSMLFKRIMGYALGDDEDLKSTISMSNLPMKRWKWQHVVYWVEKVEEFRNFASIFFEWKINGEELLAMGDTHIRWLTSCCYRQEKVDKNLVKDLLIEIKKQMISTTVTYQYGIYYKTIRKHHEDIAMLLDYLRPKKEQGPKALWKLDAFYFSKIDNLLAILIAPKLCRELFREWNPLFIFDDEETHSNVIQQQEVERIRSQSDVSKPGAPSLVAKQTGTIEEEYELKLSDSDDKKKVNKQTSTDENEVPTAVRYVDWIDRCASISCLEDNICGTCLRNFDRIYLKVICLYMFAISFGCLVVWFWMSQRSRYEVDISMKWSAESIVARSIQYMQNDFFIPQMLINIVIGGLYSGDITINLNDYANNSQFDEFFAQYKQFKVSESSIYSLCMYEAQNNSMICANNAVNSTGAEIAIFDAECLRIYTIDTESKQRDVNEVVRDSCNDYDPTARPWYELAHTLALDDIGWTEPYIFAQGAIGVSLVRRIEYNGVEVIFLAEFTTDELDYVFRTIGSVLHGVTYLTTSRGSVIASSIGEHDLNLAVTDCGNSSCTASNTLLLDSIAMLRDNADDDHILQVYNNSVIQNDFVLTLNSFSTTYLNGNNSEYATIVVVYGDQHLERIQAAETATMALYILALSIAVVVTCTMGIYLQHLQHELKYTLDPTGIQIRQQRSIDLDVIQEQISHTFADRAETIADRNQFDKAISADKEYLSTKYDSYLVDSDCIMDHRTITSCTFWYLMVIFLCTFYIWQSNVDHTLDDITEIFLTEEYMIVEDKVVNVVIIAESIADIVVERFNRGDMDVRGENIPRELDVFFANIMSSFKQENGDFHAHMLYIGIPDGKFIGSRRETSSDNTAMYGNTLRITVRDNSTGWDYVHYAANPDTLQRNASQLLSSNSAYDPRCRGWFQQVLSYMVDGDLWTAFGDAETFLQWYYDDDELRAQARTSSNCEDAIDSYLALWNVTDADVSEIVDVYNGSVPDGVSLNTNTFYADKIKAQNISYDITWSQYLFASGGLGLTAAKPIIDQDTGELLAVMAIDFTLAGFSDYLDSTNNHDNDEDPWQAWIFTGDSQLKMIASSDGEITETLKDIEGCIQAADTAADEVVQIVATEHSNFTIRVISKELVEFYFDMDDLPINTTTEPEQIDLPLDLPDALSGRFLTYPYSNYSAEVSLNWIVTKAIDITQFETKENDDIKIIGFVLTVLLFAVYMIQVNLVTSTVKVEGLRSATDETDDVVADHVSSANLSRSRMDATTRKANQSRAQEKYSKLLSEMVNIVEGSSAEIWYVFLSSFKATIGDYPISTSIVRDFMAKESNKHIKTDDNDDLTLALCALELENQWVAFKTLKFIRSSLWNKFITTVIFFHIMCGIYLPETQVVFKKERFTHSSSAVSIIFISLFVVIEIIDVSFQILARFIWFRVIDPCNLICLIKLKFGFNHPYVKQVDPHSEPARSTLWLMFFGLSNWKLFQLHLFLVLLILFNMALMVFLGLAPFEYYLPIVPIFLVVRSEDIRHFSYEFFYAVYLAKDVLFSYILLIFIVSILALAAFKDVLNPDQTTDTYYNSMRALITSFVFVSTGENYNEVVYSAINQAEDNESDIWFVEIENTISIFNLSFFVVVSIIGLYFFIPVMIHKFELAFKHSQQRIIDRTLKTKINNIIAAFIMLDMNDDGEISVDEFQHLVHSSIISRDVLFDAFANASGDEDNKISLFEFTSTLTNRRSFSVAINGFKCEVWRIQAFLECNWYRRRKIRYYLLIYIMIPAVCTALLRGLSGIEPHFLNGVVHVFFVLHFLDINIRCFAFGRKRYFSLVRYSNPPLIQQAMYNWRVERAIAQIDDLDDSDFGHTTVRLSHESKKWCYRNLRSIKPLSAWQKMTVSTVHQFEFYLIWFASAGLIAALVVPQYLDGYYYLFIQFYLFRLFTLIEANQRLVVLIFTIIPKFLNLLSFLGVFIFIWARIGCTVFAGKTEFVIDDIYSTAANATFNTLGQSILTLMQLMVGEGWHEIMYINMIGTRIEYSIYFILYIFVVTLIISNIFVGLFLSEIEGLDNKQSESDLVNQWMESHYKFQQIASKRRTDLMKKLKETQFVERDLQKQIERIDQLLQTKAKKKKSKWNILLPKDHEDINSSEDDS